LDDSYFIAIATISSNKNQKGPLNCYSAKESVETNNIFSTPLQ
jgi:hypothetical protein